MEVMAVAMMVVEVVVVVSVSIDPSGKLMFL
jgi:hypothetical protein